MNMAKKILNYIFFITVFCFLSCTSVAADSEKITLVANIDGVSNKISNTFEYKIQPVGDLANSNTENLKNVKVSFNNATPNNKSVSSSYDIDFSNVNYTHLGVYEYVITETNSSDKQTFPVSTEKYKIFVEVTVNERDEIKKRVHPQVFDLNADEKTDLVFNHKAKYTYISIQNNITGELAKNNEYFKYKISISGNLGDIYCISGQDNIVFYKGKRIITTKNYIVKSGDNNYVYVYLRGNQRVTIGLLDNDPQIPIGAKYELLKMDAGKWETSINGKREIKTNSLITKNDDNLINIINKKSFVSSVIGVFINILPFIILMSLGISGIFIILKLERK